MSAAAVGTGGRRHVEVVANLAGSIAASERLTEREGRLVGPMEFHCEPGERLLLRLDQIDALLLTIAGEGMGPFQRMNPASQEAYLQTVCDLVSAARVDATVCFHPAQSTLDNGAG